MNAGNSVRTAGIGVSGIVSVHRLRVSACRVRRLRWREEKLRMSVRRVRVHVHSGG